MSEVRTDFGPPYFKDMMPPLMVENYGKWAYHENAARRSQACIRDWRCRVVGASSPRLLAVDTVREICDIADKYCDGHLRFTSRHNIEFLLTDESKVQPLIAGGQGQGLAGRWNQQRYQQYRSHPGVDPLP